MPKAASQLLGIWDLRTTPLTLGGAITFVGDLHARAAATKLSLGAICFVGDDAHTLAEFGQPAVGEAVWLDDESCVDVPSLAALLSLEGIDALCYGRDLDSVRSLSDVTWPQLPEVSGVIDYEYATTLYLQEASAATGTIAPYTSKEAPLLRAAALLADHARSSTVVAVHLRNQSNAQGGSNADLAAWASFFQHAASFDAQFVLLGNEKLGDAIPQMANVALSRNYGATIVEDIALIQLSDAFMGMASGPCNMAMFTDNPYVIFKNPTDHAEHIQREIGDADRFPFAKPNQKLLRVWETPERLMSEFEAIYAVIGRSDHLPAGVRNAHGE